jgi:phosphoglucosamine mutase
MARLFGTDGARGIANKDLNCELAMKIGRAAALVLAGASKTRRPRILIGCDTRISSKMLEAALSIYKVLSGFKTVKVLCD